MLASCPRACYAMSGIPIAHGLISLRACYAMSVTDLAYAATRCEDVREWVRPPYQPTLVLCGVRY
eukprot:3941913-Rhodomonas_salina.1